MATEQEVTAGKAGQDLLNILSKSAGGGNIFSREGQFDIAGLLGGVFHTVEFRSKLTPSVQVKMADLIVDTPRSPWGQLLQPTVVFYGPSGETTIAPMGVSRPNVGLVVGLGIVAAIFGAGFMFGRASKRK